MKNNKLSRMLEPSLGLYLACLVLFALASAFFSIPLAVIEGVVVIILYLYLRRSNSIRKREMLRYIESVTANMDVATRVSVQLQMTDPDLKSRDRVVKKSEKDSLYAAMDVGCIWLERALAGK